MANNGKGYSQRKCSKMHPIYFLLNWIDNGNYNSSSDTHPQTQLMFLFRPRLTYFCQNIFIPYLVSRDPPSLCQPQNIQYLKEGTLRREAFFIRLKTFFLRKLFWFSLFMYGIQHCFICRPSDSTVSEDAGIEPRTVATTALAVRRSNQSARSHPQTQLDLIHIQLDLFHTQQDLM